MSDYDLRQIDGITDEKSYSREEVIIQEFTAAERFFIIYKGKIEITKKFEDGEEFVLAVHSNGDFFGEMALLDEGPRSATARALEPTTVFEISRHNFETLLYKAPALAFSIMTELSSRLRETGALLVSHLQRKNRQLYHSYIDTITIFVQAIEARSHYFHGHTQRVNIIAKAIGEDMGFSEEELSTLEIAALLHDIGKVGIADSILLKRGPLKDSEYAKIKEHPQRGKDMMHGISYLEKAIPHVLSHHERFDGRGYPENLSGDDIPLPARIIALANVFDAMTSDRPYRKAASTEEAINEIEASSGKQFDPQVVKSFLRVWKSKGLTALLKNRGK